MLTKLCHIKREASADQVWRLSTVLQKRAVRNIAKVDYRAHTSPLFEKLDLLKVTDIIMLFSDCIVYV